MPDFFVKAQVFKGSITEIGYMQTATTAEGIATVDRYIFTRQENTGLYLGTRVEGESATHKTELEGAFTLNAIAQRIRDAGMQGEPLGTMPMTLRLTGSTASHTLLDHTETYGSVKDGLAALTPYFGISTAIAQVGNAKIAQRYLAALTSETDAFRHMNDAIGLYYAATNRQEQQQAMAHLATEMEQQKQISGLPVLFRNHRGLAQRLEDVFSEEKHTASDAQDVRLTSVFLDDLKEANHQVAQMDKAERAALKKAAHRH